ncbi:hypothetical protein ACR30L_15755 [Psychromonas sp. PT13]
MGNDLGSIYLSQLVAKNVMENTIYGKPSPKRKSRIKALVKKIIK